MGIGDREYMRSGSGIRFPRMGVIPWIIAINVAVFILWQIAGSQPGLYAFMRRNFLVSAVHIEYGRFWTLLTAAFSHNLLMHLLLNMFVLHGFGRVLEQRWGPRRFLAFYLIAAVLSSAAHPIFTALGWPGNPALGASGAISALIACFALYYPRATLLFMFVIPMPAWVLLVILAGIDTWGLIEQRAGGGWPIGHAVHLGGTLTGVVYVFFIERHRVRFSQRFTRPRARARILRPSDAPWRSASVHGPEHADERRLDELLEKVSRGGLDSLTIEEREALERISEQRRQGRF